MITDVPMWYTDAVRAFTYRAGNHSSSLRFRSKAEVLRHVFDGTGLGEVTVVDPAGGEEVVTRLRWMAGEIKL